MGWRSFQIADFHHPIGGKHYKFSISHSDFKSLNA